MQKLIEAANKLELAAMKVINSDGLYLTELLVAVNYYNIVKTQVEQEEREELEKFEKYFNK